MRMALGGQTNSQSWQRHALLAAVGIHDERGHAAVALRDGRTFVRILEGDRGTDHVVPGDLEAREDLREIGALGEGERTAFDDFDGHGGWGYPRKAYQAK
jgi:hypothetical protein